LDGIVVEFYTSSRMQTSDEYWRMISRTIESKSFPKGTKRGLITLIYKVGIMEDLSNS
jgi:hypothetical protein